jgi:teichuronic acid biosynthesis glycosyltransferase TuaC
MQKFRPLLLNTNSSSATVTRKAKVLFLGNKNRPGKNFPLVQAAIEQLGRPDIELVCPYPIAHQDIPQYLNDADLLAFPSFMEGSPNVIKEAMACNCPIVSTDVGDVSWVFGKTEGCYLASFDAGDFAKKIAVAINFSQAQGKTMGRQRIIELGLDMETVAKRIMEVYDYSLKHQNEYQQIDSSTKTV